MEFFPDDLGADLPLGLVGDHVFGEELGTLGQIGRQEVQQLLHPLAGLSGDGDDGLEVVGGLVGLHDGQKLLLLHRVDLVDD